MKKRIVSLLLTTCLLLPLGLTACNDDPAPVPPESFTIAGEDI